MRVCPYKNPGKRIVSQPVARVNHPSGSSRQKVSKQNREQAVKQAKRKKKKVEKILKTETVKPPTQSSSLKYFKTTPQNQMWKPMVRKGTGGGNTSKPTSDNKIPAETHRTADPLKVLAVKPGWKQIEVEYVDATGRSKMTQSWIATSN